MSWERDPLLAKTRLFFGRAFNTERDDPVFGLWCSLGLEMLARTALASVSPALLAQPEPNQRNLLHVLHRDSEILFPKSISASLVFDLCCKIFPTFSEEDRKVALALLNRRNEELHSGAAAFEEYRPSQWLVGFYHACKSLNTELGETLANLFGEDDAKFAEQLLAENRDNLKKEILSKIAAHKTVFNSKKPAEQKELIDRAEMLVQELSTQRHHTVDCPACACKATLQGTPFGKEHVTNEENGEIVTRQAVLPNEFLCTACGLKLTTNAELEVADLGEHYTRKTTYSPEEYYGLINPNDIDSYLESYMGFDEYDNE